MKNKLRKLAIKTGRLHDGHLPCPVFEALDAAGVQVLSLTDPYLNSELLRGLFAGIAADERRRILERTHAGRTTKAAAGGYPRCQAQLTVTFTR